MSKKVLNYAGRRPMLLAFIMATLALGLLFSGWLTPLPMRAQTGGGNSSSGNENTNCDNPTTSLWCGGSAQLVLSNVVINPAAPTNAPYDCIVCVCDSVSANLQWFTVPSTNATQTCHTCNGSTPTNYCDPIVYTAGASPYNITNEWWNGWWQGATNGIGDSVSFSYTNATGGWIYFDNISAMMPTNAPGCGVWVHWADNAYSWRSYAFVAVDSISCDTWNLVTNNPMPTYSVDFCPGSYVTVTASPSPGMDDKFLPGGWSMSGGLATTNADGSPGRTKRLVDCGQIGTNVVTATSGCSSKSLAVIIGAPYLNIVALSSGNSISSANSNNAAMVGQNINLYAVTGGSCGTFSNFQWSVPGYAIGGYEMGSGGSSDSSNPSTNIYTSESLTTYFPTTNSTVSFYWVDGGTKTVSCSAVCGGVTCSTNVTISVTRPGVAMGSQSSPIWDARGYPYYYIGISLGDISSGANKLNYDVIINSPTDGNAVTVQIVNSYAINGTEQVTGQQADGCVPYQGYISSILKGGSPKYSILSFEDGPQAGTYFWSVALSANFYDYVMYQATIDNTIYANLGGDTIYVPLGKVFWQINGGAHLTSPVSITIDPDEFQLDGPDNSTDFPVWASIFVPHH